MCQNSSNVTFVFPNPNGKERSTTKLDGNCFTFLENGNRLQISQKDYCALFARLNSSSFPRWFHIYLHNESDGIETYRRVSLRGSFNSRSSHGNCVLTFQPHKDGQSVAGKVSPDTSIDKELEKLESFHKHGGSKIFVQFHTKVNLCYSENHLPNIDSEINGRLVIHHTYYLPEFLEDYPSKLDRTSLEEIGLDGITTNYFDTTASLDLGENFVKIGDRETQTIVDCDKFGLMRYRLHGVFQEKGRTEKNPNWVTPNFYMFRDSNEKYSYKSKFYIGLSHHNVIEVREELFFDAIDVKSEDSSEENPLRVKNLIKFLLGYRYSDQPDPSECQDIGVKLDGRYPSVVEEIVRKFVYAILTSVRPEGIEVPDCLRKSDAISTKRIRQRYVVVLVHEVLCTNSRCLSKKRVIPPDRFDSSGIPEMLLEGSLFFKENGSVKHYPQIRKLLTAGPTINASLNTWAKEESCHIGMHRTIVYSMAGTLLHTRRTPANYTYYWYCVARAMQHSISLRTLITILERAVDRNATDLSTKDDSGELEAVEIEKRLSLIRRFLPAARSVSIPTSAFRAPHAVRKFEYLYNELFRFPEILENIGIGLTELMDKVQLDKQERILVSNELRRNNERNRQVHLSILGLLIGGIATVLAYPQVVPAIARLIQPNSGANDAMSWKYIAVASFLYWLVVSVFHIAGIISYWFLVEFDTKKSDTDSDQSKKRENVPTVGNKLEKLDLVEVSRDAWNWFWGDALSGGQRLVLLIPVIFASIFLGVSIALFYMHYVETMCTVPR